MSKRKFLKFSLNTILFSLFRLNGFPPLYSKSLDLRKTKILTHPIFLKHIISHGHPEKPERIKYILDLFKSTEYQQIVENIDLDYDVSKWVRMLHTNEHINSLKKNFPIAEKVSASAIKACLQGIDDIINNKTQNVFCALRPPGHHALNTGKDEGFCFYNHIAIAAKYLQEKHNKKKILIVDWDYHHGNSTELFFYNDPSVLFFSTHDAFAYPGTGSPNRKGIGPGLGFNINIHLPCGTQDKDIIKVFNDVLAKKANLFKPDFVLISAGFDSRENDLLGCFKITDSGFKELTKIVMRIAKENCNGNLLSLLEGGYNLPGNASATLSHIETLYNFK